MPATEVRPGDEGLRGCSQGRWSPLLRVRATRHGRPGRPCANERSAVLGPVLTRAGISILTDRVVLTDTEVSELLTRLQAERTENDSSPCCGREALSRSLSLSLPVGAAGVLSGQLEGLRGAGQGHLPGKCQGFSFLLFYGNLRRPRGKHREGGALWRQQPGDEVTMLTPLSPASPTGSGSSPCTNLGQHLTDWAGPAGGPGGVSQRSRPPGGLQAGDMASCQVWWRDGAS